jgi:hypothetical protein
VASKLEEKVGKATVVLKLEGGVVNFEGEAEEGLTLLDKDPPLPPVAVVGSCTATGTAEPPE